MEETSVPRSELDLDLDPGVDARASSDLPMFEMTIKVFGWERGQAEIETTCSGALGDLFDTESPDDAGAIFGELHTRLQEEITEAFEILRRCRRPSAGVPRAGR